MFRLLVLLVVVALGAGSGVAAAHRDAAAPQPPLRVLFIGNSLTATNDLPAFVAALARRHGDTTFRYRTIAPPGVSLEDHWRIARTRRALAEERWDAVVIQQGPSSDVGGRAHLCTWTRRFADLVRSRGAQPYVLGVWSAGRFGLPHVIETYATAAAAADARLLPAGTAWAEAWQRKPSLALHMRDGIHPTRLATYLTALVVYGGLRGVDPRSLSANLVVAKRPFRASAPNAALARAAAATAVTKPPAAGSCTDDA